LTNFITSDETWIYSYDVETKQSSHWKSPASPHPKKAQQAHLQVRAILLLIFYQGIVHYEFAPEGQTII
jgi:hypothetical protein